jgi:hypothetical protein
MLTVERASSCCDTDGDRGSRQDHISGVAQLASQHLTKSRYIAGLQCLRRLWLLVHEPQPYEEPAPGSPMDIGQEIGRKAHLLFPGGSAQHITRLRTRCRTLMRQVAITTVFDTAAACVKLPPASILNKSLTLTSF